MYKNVLEGADELYFRLGGTKDKQTIFACWGTLGTEAQSARARQPEILIPSSCNLHEADLDTDDSAPIALP